MKNLTGLLVCSVCAQGGMVATSGLSVRKQHGRLEEGGNESSWALVQVYPLIVKNHPR